MGYFCEVRQCRQQNVRASSLPITKVKGVPVRLVMGGRDLENNTMEVMRRDTLEKETRSCDGIEEYVKRPA